MAVASFNIKPTPLERLLHCMCAEVEGVELFGTPVRTANALAMFSVKFTHSSSRSFAAASVRSAASFFMSFRCAKVFEFQRN